MEQLMERALEKGVEHIAERVLEKGVEQSLKVVWGRFFRKKVTYLKNLKFCLLIHFYTPPKYDECMLGLDSALRNIRDANKLIKWKQKDYQYYLSIGQKTNIIPFLCGQIIEDPDEVVLESITASDARIYIFPKASDEISGDALERMLKDAYELLRHIEDRARQTKLEIREAVKFIEFALDENKGVLFLPCINRAEIPTRDHYDATKNQRIMEIRIEDSSVIHSLIACLRR
jgi:hypothetical protein